MKLLLRIPCVWGLVSLCVVMQVSTVFGQQTSGVEAGVESSMSDFVDMSLSGVVSYSADFFRRYQPNTALDVVNRVPGFILDDGGDKRGFGGAAGNVLINDRRPSTKQDVPSAILGRISSSLVERVELIRVRIRDIDLLGQSEVVNVILRDDAPATVRWESHLRYNLDHGLSPGAGISLSDHWREIEYNVGLDTRYSKYSNPGVIETYNADDVLTEIRSDSEVGTGPEFYGFLNSSTWFGSTFFQLNSRAGIEYRDIIHPVHRIPQIPGNEPRQEIIETLRRNNRLELGIDAERILHSNLLGKAIFLFSMLDQDPSSSQQSLNAAGQQTRFQLQDEDAKTTETIARLEFDWAGFENHAIKADIELALNALENTQLLTDDTGTGPVIVDVPGGNVRVEETRWNFLLQDTWSLGNFDLDYGLGYERSTISQSGDAEQERTFSFLVPRAILTYSPVRGQQTRLRFERDISQLNFGDFVSATVFEDDKVNLGNPDIHPDNTWIAEFSHERRFGRTGVVRLSTFHHWIRDVLDLLPLTPTFDAPGNIGDGRRWGLILEVTAPLDVVRLENAQLGFRVRWQDSTVIDPVTGEYRMLSGEGGYRSALMFQNENRYAFGMDFRQDFEEALVSWGWELLERDKRVLYKANELDVFNDGIDLHGFIETTRWFGLKISVEGENILNNSFKRDRTVFVNGRTISPIERREFRDGDNGARITLRISGSF